MDFPVQNFDLKVDFEMGNWSKEAYEYNKDILLNVRDWWSVIQNA